MITIIPVISISLKDTELESVSFNPAGKAHYNINW